MHHLFADLLHCPVCIVSIFNGKGPGATSKRLDPIKINSEKQTSSLLKRCFSVSINVNQAEEIKIKTQNQGFSLKLKLCKRFLS